MIKAHIVGRLGKDAEEATIGQKQAIRFRIATDDREKAKDGTWTKKTTWVTVATYQTGLKPYLTKGKQVLVSGDLRVGLWTKNDGTTELDASVFGADVTLLAGEASQDAQNAPQSTNAAWGGHSTAQPPQGQQRQSYAQQSGPSDDLPF